MTIVASNSLTLSKVNDGTITHTAWSYSADGTDGFTTAYPNLNLLEGTSSVLKTVSDKGWGHNYVESKTNALNLKKGQTLTYSIWIQDCDIDTRGVVYLYDSQNKQYNNLGNIIKYGTSGFSTVTFTINIDVVRYNIGIGFTGNQESYHNLKYSRLKLEQGSTATPYMQSASEVTTADWPKYIGHYTDFTQADSINPSDYTWGPMRGNDGISPTVKINPDTSLTIVDAKGTITTPVLKGSDGTDGTSGIIVSSVAPDSPQTGQLWQDTSTTPQLVKKWTGTSWVIWEFYAQNLKADSLSALSANLGDVKAGTLSGTNLSMNLNTGAVQFTKGYIASNNSKIRFDLDNSYFHSLNSGGSGFKISNGQLSFFDGLLGGNSQYLGAIMLDVYSPGYSGIKIAGNKGASIQGGDYGITIGYSISGNDNIEIIGHTRVTGNLSVLGSKNAIHITRDGARATPAYETAESYLGDIGGNYTRENCEVWVNIDELFSDTVNTDIAYEVFLQAYDDARFWVSDFKSDKFLIKSDKPMARFAWEIKAKRRGYENDRLVIQEGFDNKMLLDAQSKGIFKGDGENESTN